jgi:biopolymer transport protein ExbB/biopolymer transport protein TolQ
MQFTLSDLWAHMGPFARFIIAVLAIMSTASLLVACERLFAFRKSRAQSIRFAAAISGPLSRGELDGAVAAAKDADGYLGRVIGAGLTAWHTSPRTDPEFTMERVARALERAAQRENQLMRRGQGVLATVSSTAPFVGLLGTVMGIVNSFQSMALTGSGGLGTVSAGIAEALMTTAFGLLVAIPAVMLFNYFTGWIEARAVDMSESSNELLDVVDVYLRQGQPGVSPAVRSQAPRVGIAGRPG